jgi:ABC-type phosphate transport system substrate-binding protein
MSPSELRTEVERLTQEIETMRRSDNAPVEWKEYIALEDKFNALAMERRKADQEFRDNMSRLAKSRAVEQWREAINRLQDRIRALQDTDFKQLTKNASALFDARHKELEKLAPATTPKATAMGLTVLNYPRVDGSTSAHPLAVLIACRCLDVPYEWVRRSANPFGAGNLGSLYSNPYDPSGIHADSEFFLAEYTVQARKDPSGSTVSDRLPPIINRLLTINASTHQAYVNIIEGKSDIGLLARPPSPDELQLANLRGVEIDAIPFALDAFVFLVNDASSVTNLTTAQIRDIYSGKTENWKDVGGPNQLITPYQRERNSGSQELMEQLVMKNIPFRLSEGKRRPMELYVLGGMMGPYVALTRDKSGLAYSVYYYEHFMSGSPRTRVLAVDGVNPTADTLRKREYPYTTEVYVVTRKGIEPASSAGKWRSWLLSPEGQAVVAESGYVPIGSVHK